MWLCNKKEKFENLKIEKKNKKDSCYLKSFLCLSNFKITGKIEKKKKRGYNIEQQ